MSHGHSRICRYTEKIFNSSFQRSLWLCSMPSTAPNSRLPTLMRGCCMIARGGGQQIAICWGPTWQGHIGDYMRHAS